MANHKVGVPPFFSPRLSPQTANMYTGYKKYMFENKRLPAQYKHVLVTVDAQGSVFHIDNSFKKHLGCKFSDVKYYFENNGFSCEIIADVDNEMWNM